MVQGGLWGCCSKRPAAGQIVNAGEVDKAELVLISLMLTRLACVNLCHSQHAVQHLDSVNVPWIKYR